MDVPPIRVFFSRWSCMDDEFSLEAGFMKYAPPSFVLPDAPEDDSICVSPEIKIEYIYYFKNCIDTLEGRRTTPHSFFIVLIIVTVK